MLPVLLLCILVLYLPLPPPSAPLPWEATATGVVALALVNALLCWAGSALAERRARRGGPAADPGGSDEPVHRVFTVLKAVVVGFVMVQAFILQWPALVEQLVGHRRWAVFAGDAILLVPALAMMMTLMAAQYRAEARTGRVVLSPWQYLWLRTRVEMGLILAPWLVLVGLTDLASALLRGSPYGESAEAVTTVGALVLLVVFSPLVLRVVWGTSRLPDGPLRARLDGFCRGHGFRCRDILLWHTHGQIANAGVMGPVPLLRYVLLTDALVSRCSEEEVEAVFAHEVGHIRYHHLLFYLVFALGFVCVYGNLAELLAALGLVEPLDHLLAFEMTLGQAVAMLGFAAVYWGLLFGYVSRRMEQQADLFSLDNASEPAAYLRALGRLGAMTGQCSHRPGGQREHSPGMVPRPDALARPRSHWRHFSIERRIEFLRRVLAEPAVGVRFARRVTLLKGAVLALVVLSLARLVLFRPELFGL